MATFKLENDVMTKGAFLSPCRSYRYSLVRQWQSGEDVKKVMFVCVNPSKADENRDDPTTRRCINFARQWGFGGLIITNAYAHRATDPDELKVAVEPIGPLNDGELEYQATQASQIVVAWGNSCPIDRERQVLRVLNSEVFCLGWTESLRPKHPVRLHADTERQLFWSPLTGYVKEHSDASPT